MICILWSTVENRGGMTKQSKRRICNERNERVSTFVHVRETGEHPLSSTSEKRTNVPPRLWSVHRFVALWIHLKGDGPRSDFNKPGNSNRRVSRTQNGFLKRPNYNIAEQWWGHQCNPWNSAFSFHFVDLWTLAMIAKFNAPDAPLRLSKGEVTWHLHHFALRLAPSSPSSLILALS